MAYVYEMWDYLSASTANYVAANLNVTPQNIMTERGYKNITIHLGDDGSEERIALDSKSIFYVNLQWDVLGTTDASTIVNHYHSTGIANGIGRSFRWSHPTDGHIYTARFDSDLSRFEVPGNLFGIAQVSLKILGRAT